MNSDIISFIIVVNDLVTRFIYKATSVGRIFKLLLWCHKQDKQAYSTMTHIITHIISVNSAALVQLFRLNN